MRARSLLFVPGDRPERFSKAEATGADAVILDLEDSVDPARKAYARDAVRDHLDAPAGPALRFVRISPVDHANVADDIAAAHKADGWVVPKAEGEATFAALGDVAPGPWPPLLPIATETPAAVFRLADYRRYASRLFGLTWGAEDLPAAIGARGSRREDGGFTPPYEMVRSLALFAAHAAEVEAIETVYPDIRDLDGLAAYAARAAFDGFTGMMAIHPSQVEPINTAFTPSPEALDEAQAIVDAFAENPGQGALKFRGRMIDAPHLKQALRLLAKAR